MAPISQDDYCQLLKQANRWMMRAKVAMALATYFCEVASDGPSLIDIKSEVELQSERLLKMLEKSGPGPVRQELRSLKKKRHSNLGVW